MGSSGKETLQRILAVLVIMAMLNVMGIPLTVIIFFAVVIFFVWRAVQRSEQQDVQNIFQFYLAANDILRDEERRWYGFEIAEVIHRGERVLSAMSDPPPLVYYALGALHHRAGDHEAAVEHLSYLLESGRGDESRCFTHSPELQRYVQELRRLERDPAEAPQTMAAIRCLDRLRRTRAAALLEESRARLKETPHVIAARPKEATRPAGQQPLTGRATPALAPPPPPDAPAPIVEVLRDLYEEEKEKKTA
jgi:tetratricopeptide (TPR) repeat protein